MDQLLVYFASPYSHSDPKVVLERYAEIRDITEAVIREVPGIVPFSAIAYSHQFGHIENVDWLTRIDFRILHACDAAMIVEMDGWSDSVGISEEIQYCKKNDIPLFYSEPEQVVVECQRMWDVVYEECSDLDEDDMSIRGKLRAGLRFFFTRGSKR